MNDRKTLSGDIDLDLAEFDSPPAEPFSLLGEWLARADSLNVRESRAVTLATLGPQGPTTRTVLVKDVADGHLVLTTSAESRKGRELEADPRCSLTFYWRETMQQIVVNGTAHKSDETESDALFSARPAAARATVIASHQSAPLTDQRALRTQAEELLASGDLGRPASWHAWHIEPHEIEFWHGSTDRFHRRLVFRRTETGWNACRLQP
ncbi:pyridoxal 5'-phosphate synthase [Micrococcus sp. FDAARGOS_333]|uniref:pyridoxal 5'-phosphate synthase n=1 Tax=Micrococcus sp. FDAARGOS_333 TaxID=1930558 RepID=UPI000B4E672C|nr:pyridoxal 5'-phosphate synthase [Micrococcus sp. FDAARGOS_333]